MSLVIISWTHKSVTADTARIIPLQMQFLTDTVKNYVYVSRLIFEPKQKSV